VVDESVSGATQLPVPTPEEASEAAPEPTETPVVPPLAEPDRPAADVAVGPSLANDGLTGELQVLTESLEDPEATEPGPDSAEPDVAHSPALTDDSLPAEAPVTEPGVPVAEEPETASPAESPVGAASATVQSASVTESLDSIAPGTVVGTERVSHRSVAVEQPVTTVSAWPFVGYVAVWLAAAGYAIWRFMQVPAGTALFETALYRTSMLVGLVLLAGGPALILIVWIVSWIGVKNARGGAMFFSALIKGAVATLLGALIWWGALLLMDYLRLGRLF